MQQIKNRGLTNAMINEICRHPTFIFISVALIWMVFVTSLLGGKVTNVSKTDFDAFTNYLRISIITESHGSHIDWKTWVHGRTFSSH